MTHSFNDKWLERTILIALAIIVMSLASLGYANIKSDTKEIKDAQKEYKTEIMSLFREQNSKIDKVCQDLRKHDSWLRVPYDQRRKFFLDKEGVQ